MLARVTHRKDRHPNGPLSRRSQSRLFRPTRKSNHRGAKAPLPRYLLGQARRRQAQGRLLLVLLRLATSLLLPILTQKRVHRAIRGHRRHQIVALVVPVARKVAMRLGIGREQVHPLCRRGQVLSATVVTPRRRPNFRRVSRIQCRGQDLDLYPLPKARYRRGLVMKGGRILHQTKQKRTTVLRAKERRQRAMALLRPIRGSRVKPASGPGADALAFTGIPSKSREYHTCSRILGFTSRITLD